MRIAIIQNMSYDYKKDVKQDKNQKLIYFFFVWKPVSKVNEFFKNIRLCETNTQFLKPSFDNNNVIIHCGQ